jgi:hypothetical protein
VAAFAIGSSRVRHQTAVGDLEPLGPDVDEQPPNARIRHDDVAAAAQDRVGKVAPAGQPHDGPQLERVDRSRVEIGAPADAHRREPGQRLVPRGADAQSALDLRARSRGVEGHAHADAPASGPPIPGAAGASAATGAGAAVFPSGGTTPSKPDASRVIAAGGG